MIYRVENEIFGHITYLIINEKWDEQKIKKEIRKLRYKDDYLDNLKEISADINSRKFSHATTYFQIYGVSIIYFFHWEGKANDYGVLQHEIFHSVDNMLRYRDINLSDDSDEVFAYCIGHLTRELYNKIWSDKS